VLIGFLQREEADFASDYIQSCHVRLPLLRRLKKVDIRYISREVWRGCDLNGTRMRCHSLKEELDEAGSNPKIREASLRKESVQGTVRFAMMDHLPTSSATETSDHRTRTM